MTKPTTYQIQTETERLNRMLKRVPRDFRVRMVRCAIEELEEGFDTTAEEWSELAPDEREIIMATSRWKRGDSCERPSELIRRMKP